MAILFICFIAHANLFIMLYINIKNTPFIIALNSFLTAVLPIPRHLMFHSSYFRVKLIQVRQTLHYLYQVCQTHFHEGPLYDEVIITLRADMEFTDMPSF